MSRLRRSKAVTFKVVCLLFLLTITLGQQLFVLRVNAITRSEDVQVTVPTTDVEIRGKSSPQAFVTVRKGQSTVATTTAQLDGTFSVVFNQPSGLQTYSVFYDDSFGIRSNVLTRTVSVQPQQTNIFSYYLSPTLTIARYNPIVVGSIVQIRGQTVPGATVQIVFDGGVKNYQTTANASGNYEYLYDSAELGSGTYSINARASQASDTSDISLTETITVVAVEDKPTPDIRVKPELLPPPTVLVPSDGTVVTGDNIVIRGESVPNAQIVVYEDGKPIGSIIADNNGNWEFSYSSQKSSTVLTFEACLAGRCSVLSKPLSLYFVFDTSPCRLEFNLQSYRFWNITENQELQLIIESISESSDGKIKVDWGDGIIEVFTSDYELKKIGYRYSSPGSYSGVIEYSNSTGSCTVTRYFSVVVVQKDADSSDWWIVFLLLIVGLVLYIVRIKTGQGNRT